MQRKKTKNTPGPTTEEKRFQAFLKEQPCCVTGLIGVDVHHIFGSTYKYNKRLIGHIACIPLHPELHRGKEGIHTIGKKRWEEMYGSQKSHFLKLADLFGLDQEIIDCVVSA